MSDLNKYLKLLNEDLKRFDEISDEFILKIMLDEYKHKLKNINSNYKLSSADMKIVQQISIKIRQLDKTLSDDVIS